MGQQYNTPTRRALTRIENGTQDEKITWGLAHIQEALEAQRASDKRKRLLYENK